MKASFTTETVAAPTILSITPHSQEKHHAAVETSQARSCETSLAFKLVETPEDKLLAYLQNAPELTPFSLSTKQSIEPEIVFSTIVINVNKNLKNRTVIQFTPFSLFTFLLENGGLCIHDIQLLGDTAMRFFPDLFKCGSKPSLSGTPWNSLSSRLEQELKKKPGIYRFKIDIPFNSLDNFETMKKMFNEFLSKHADLQHSELCHDFIFDIPDVFYVNNCYATFSVIDESSKNRYEFIISQNNGAPSPFNSSECILSLKNYLHLPNLNKTDIDSAAAEKWSQACVDRLTGCMRINHPVDASHALTGLLDLALGYLQGKRPAVPGTESKLLDALKKTLTNPYNLPPVCRKDLKQSESIPLESPLAYYVKTTCEKDFDKTIALLTQLSIILNRNGCGNCVSPLWKNMQGHLKKIHLKGNKEKYFPLWECIYELMSQDPNQFVELTSLLEIKTFLSLSSQSEPSAKESSCLYMSEETPAFKAWLAPYYLNLNAVPEHSWQTWHENRLNTSSQHLFREINRSIASEKCQLPSRQSPLARNQHVLGVNYSTLASCLEKYSKTDLLDYQLKLILQGILACNTIQTDASTWDAINTVLAEFCEKMPENKENELVKSTLKIFAEGFPLDPTQELPSNLLWALILAAKAPQENRDNAILQAHKRWKQYRKENPHERCSKSELWLLQEIASHRHDLGADMLQTLTREKKLDAESHFQEIEKILASICRGIREHPEKTAQKLFDILQKVNDTFHGTPIPHTLFLHLLKNLDFNKDSSVVQPANKLILNIASSMKKIEIAPSLIKNILSLLDNLLDYSTCTPTHQEAIYNNLQSLLMLRQSLEVKLTEEEKGHLFSFDQKFTEAVIWHKGKDSKSISLLTGSCRLALSANHPLFALQGAIAAIKMDIPEEDFLSLQEIILGILDNTLPNCSDFNLICNALKTLFDSQCFKRFSNKTPQELFNALSVLFPHLKAPNESQQPILRTLLRYSLELCGQFKTTHENYRQLLPLLHLCLTPQPSTTSALYKALKAHQKEFLETAAEQPEENSKLIDFLSQIPMQKAPKTSAVTKMNRSVQEALMAAFQKELNAATFNFQAVLALIEKKPDSKTDIASKIDAFIQILRTKGPNLSPQNIYQLLFDLADIIIHTAKEGCHSKRLNAATNLWNAMRTAFPDTEYANETEYTLKRNDTSVISQKGEVVQRLLKILDVLLNGYTNSPQQFSEHANIMRTVLQDTSLQFILNSFSDQLIDAASYLPIDNNLSYLSILTDHFMPLLMKQAQDFRDGENQIIPHLFLISIGKNSPIEQSKKYFDAFKSLGNPAGTSCAICIGQGILNSKFHVPLELKKELANLLAKAPPITKNFVLQCLNACTKTLSGEIRTKIWTQLIANINAEYAGVSPFSIEHNRVCVNFLNFICQKAPELPINWQTFNLHQQMALELLSSICVMRNSFPQALVDAVIKFLNNKIPLSKDQEFSKNLIYIPLLIEILDKPVSSPQLLYKTISTATEILKFLQGQIDPKERLKLLLRIPFMHTKRIIDSCFGDTEIDRKNNYTEYMKNMRTFTFMLIKNDVIREFPALNLLLHGLPIQKKDPHLLPDIKNFLTMIKDEYTLAKEKGLLTGYGQCRRLHTLAKEGLQQKVFDGHIDVYKDIADFIVTISFDYGNTPLFAEMIHMSEELFSAIAESDHTAQATGHK